MTFLIVALALLARLLVLSLTHTIRLSVSGGASEGLASTIVVTAGAEANMGETMSSPTNQLLAFVLDVSQCKSIFILSDVNATLKTNSSGSPAATLTLIAGEALVWVSTQDADCPHPFGSTDVTALYYTATGTATLYIRCSYDPTV